VGISINVDYNEDSNNDDIEGTPTPPSTEGVIKRR
jgi:hypothetical protein